MLLASFSVIVLLVIDGLGANFLQSGFSKWCLMEVVMRKLRARPGECQAQDRRSAT